MAEGRHLFGGERWRNAKFCDSSQHRCEIKYKCQKAKFFFKKNFSSFLAISSGAKSCTQQLGVHRQHFANLSEACGDRLCGFVHFIHSGAKLEEFDSVWPKEAVAVQINASSSWLFEQYLQGDQQKLVTQFLPVLKQVENLTPYKTIKAILSQKWRKETYFKRKTNIWRCGGWWWVFLKSLWSLPGKYEA